MRWPAEFARPPCAAHHLEGLLTGRLGDALRGRNGEPAIQAVLDAIRTSVEEFTRGQPQGDDQTLLVVRRDG